MSGPRPAIEEITGYFGVGSMGLLGLFFIVDGASNFMPFAETIFKTETWGILATVPMLVIAYVLGLVSSLAAEALISHFVRPVLTPQVFAAVATSGNELLAQRFADTERHARLLYGCTVAFLVLAAGSLFETRVLGTYSFVGHFCALAGVIVASLCPVLAFRLQAQLVPFIHAVIPIRTDDG